MQPVYITDPAWCTTFPHLVAPLHDEWLAGLLLRCDEVNHWESGTTLAHVSYSYGRTLPMKSLYWMFPVTLKLDYLAQALAIPQGDIVATTYQLELKRLFDTPEPQPRQLSQLFHRFHLCSECFAQERLLNRFLILPYITCCQRHQVMLVNECRCGKPLRLFSKETQPFTCPYCDLNWANLPRAQAPQERITIEKQYLSNYEFFLSEGTPKLLVKGKQLLADTIRKKQMSGVPLINGATKYLAYATRSQVTLGYLVHGLVSLELSPSLLKNVEEK